MQNDFKEYTIFDAVTPKAITSSTDANPVVITKASHGLTTGDVIFIYGHATNVAINGVWKVTVVNSSTFKVADINTGTFVAGSGAGAGGGTGLFCTAPKIPLVSDFNNAEISIITADTATLTMKIAGSIGTGDRTGGSPNFGATVSASNPYTFLGAYNLDSGNFLDGSTGIAAAGTDLNLLLKVNTSGQKFLTVIPTAWTQGSMTVKVMLFKN
jgi:hypothetical protein